VHAHAIVVGLLSRTSTAAAIYLGAHINKASELQIPYL
jgi:hypothetical protein